MSEKIIRKYFAEPYGDSFWVYNNRVMLDDIPKLPLHQLLSHQRACDLGEQYRQFAGKSIALLIHEAILKDYGSVKGKKVLDLGCSIGHFALLMAEEGAEVTGVDYEPEKIEVANAFASIYKLRLKFVNDYIESFLQNAWFGMEYQAHALDQKLHDGTFDLVLMHNVYDRIPIERNTKALSQIVKLSKRLYTTINVDPTTWKDFSGWRLLIPKIYGVRDLIVFWK